ncbi:PLASMODESMATA CALLOSE-BINDING PROTEIN 3-like [Salvia miltiorrhiza]|uniref:PLASMODESMATA CALLOSE-BINDING PROTEIN 3-like n=1 Tax=Salvia miltiorrhiza TaxID=226208 RepID=UPI0025AB6172|nr:PLASMODESMATA CALLOSE-BINDING PROTEIN 3-like [Salvia miltiorrhiza]
MAFTFKAVALLLAATFSAAAGTWCVVRSDATEVAMQRALDYACSGGADCAPIQSSGLCYLPNTLPAHASYAINSYYQRRRANDPAACSFAGAAAIAATDPSYGSCVYPSSPRNAGGMVPTPTGTNIPSTMPTLTQPPPPPTAPLYGGGGMGSVVAESPMSSASQTCFLKRSIFYITCVIFLLVFLPNLHL